jgi:hypothetical protein
MPRMDVRRGVTIQPGKLRNLAKRFPRYSVHRQDLKFRANGGAVRAPSTRRLVGVGGAVLDAGTEVKFVLSQVVEDILNAAEEIAVAEGGPAGEVTLLRLLKVCATHVPPIKRALPRAASPPVANAQEPRAAHSHAYGRHITSPRSRALAPSAATSPRRIIVCPSNYG